MKHDHLNESTFFMVVLIVGLILLSVFLFATPAADPPAPHLVGTTTTSTGPTTTGPVTPQTAAPPVTVAMQPEAEATAAPKRPLNAPKTALIDPEAASAPEEGAATTTTPSTMAPCFDDTAAVSGVDRCRPTSDFPDSYPGFPRCYEGAAPPTYEDSDGNLRQPYDGIDWTTGQPFTRCVHDPTDP